MPRPAVILAALVLAAGGAAAETATKPPASAATPAAPAPLRNMPPVPPRLSVVSFQRLTSNQGTGLDLVAKLSNAADAEIPSASWGVEVKCTSPSVPTHVVRRALEAIPPHAELTLTVFENRQDVPKPPPTKSFGPQLPGMNGSPFGGGGMPMTTGKQAAPFMDPNPKPPLVAGPAWSCTAGVGPASGAGGFPVQSTASWGVEFDFGISDIAFEKAMTAPPTVNVRVAVLSKKIGTLVPAVASIPHTLQLACSKPGQTPRNAGAPAADSVLFGAAGAGFLPAPATGWSCRATLSSPAPDKDPSNDTWALTAP